MPSRMSDSFYGDVQDTIDLPKQQAADALGCSVSQIVNARRRIREGKVLLGPEAWSDDEDEILRVGVNMTAKQLAEKLPGRNYEAIKARRRLVAAVGRVVRHADPFAVSGRPLIAKTCTACGELLPADWFNRRNDGRYWKSACRRCCASRARDARERNGRSSVALQRRYQEVTLAHASRKSGPYTTSEMKVLADETLTHVEKALTLHRTYFGVRNAVKNYGFSSAPRSLDDLTQERWLIEFEREVAA